MAVDKNSTKAIKGVRFWETFAVHQDYLRNSKDYESNSASRSFKVSPMPVMVTSPSSTNYNSLAPNNNNNNNNNNNTPNAAHNNNSINKNRRLHTLPPNTMAIATVALRHPHMPMVLITILRKATLCLLQMHAKIFIIQLQLQPTPPDNPFGVRITHVPFVIPSK